MFSGIKPRIFFSYFRGIYFLRCWKVLKTIKHNFRAHLEIYFEKIAFQQKQKLVFFLEDAFDKLTKNYFQSRKIENLCLLRCYFIYLFLHIHKLLLIPVKFLWNKWLHCYIPKRKETPLHPQWRRVQVASQATISTSQCKLKVQNLTCVVIPLGATPRGGVAQELPASWCFTQLPIWLVERERGGQLWMNRKPNACRW